MAALDATTRERLRHEVSQILGADTAQPCGLDKPQVLQAVVDIDTYLEANAAAMKLSISQPARGALTNAQIARLFAAVVIAKYGG